MRVAGPVCGHIGFDDPRVLAWRQTIGCDDMSGIDALNIFKHIQMAKTEAEIEINRKSAQMSEMALNSP